jgi:hypothetical protein
MEVGMAAAAATTVVLPLHSTVVATKTPATTAMVGAQSTTNNQLKVAEAMATETGTMTVTTMTMKTKAKGAAVVAAVAAAAVNNFTCTAPYII